MISLELRRGRGPGGPELHADATFPARDGAWELALPCWRPGRYELGNFAQYLLALEALADDGTWHRLPKSALHRWSVAPGLRRFRWRFHAGILNAGSTCLGADLFYINPVNCILFDPERPGLSYSLALPDIPASWDVATGLPRGADGTFVAADFDRLADAPLLAAPELWHRTYEEAGSMFHVWAYGAPPREHDRFLDDHRRFTACMVGDFGGTFPELAYHFLYLFPDLDVRHGVEHADSTVIVMGPPERVATEEGHEELISIASHELYHAWNVKRLRPAEWLPYDFERAVPSRLGYVAEGVTTYMGDLYLHESGCIDTDAWLRRMNEFFRRHYGNPGRLNMSVADSGFDTWLDGYIPGVTGRKSSIYIEGAVLAFLCDVRIMQRSGGSASLQTAIASLHDRLVPAGLGVTESLYWAALDAAAGAPGATADLRARFCDGCEDTREEVEAAMKWMGLRFEG